MTVLAWENLQEVFCDVGCCCSSFIAFRRFYNFVLHSLLFNVILPPSVSYRQVFTPILYFQPSSLQSDSWHFHFNLSGPFCYSFTAIATDLRVLFTLRCFLPYTLSRHLAQPNFTKASLGAGSSPLKVAGPPTEVWNTDPADLFVWITQCSPKVISR